MSVNKLVEMTGVAGNVMCNESQVAEYESRDYTRATHASAEVEAKAEAEVEVEAEAEAEVEAVDLANDDDLSL